MKIMIFLHGTALMHASGEGRTRAEWVQQVRDRHPAVYDFAAYVPVDNVVNKLRAWRRQGVEIVYLSSHRRAEAVELDQAVLHRHDFPDGHVFFRQPDEQYRHVAERVRPDILIEDDCESIGGESEMTYPEIQLALKATIKSIVVREFGGIDHLPDSPAALLSY
jgi:hypothetical protein